MPVSFKEKDMKFPNAKKGISKILLSEIIYIIATAVSLIGVLVLIIAGKTSEGLAAGTGLVILIGMAVVTVSSIIQLVGIIQARKDEKCFKYAILVLILNVILAIFASAFEQNAVLNTIFATLETISELAVIILIVKAIVNLANHMQEPEIADKGMHLIKNIIIVNAIEIIAKLTEGLTKDTVMEGVTIALLVCTSVAAIIKYFIYINLLSKTKKMLSEDTE